MPVDVVGGVGELLYVFERMASLNLSIAQQEMVRVVASSVFASL